MDLVEIVHSVEFLEVAVDEVVVPACKSRLLIE